MRTKIFGRRTGLRVSELALGTGNFGTGWGHGAERDEAKKIFDGYAEAGGYFIDTAEGYQAGQSEALVGEFIASERDHFVLATKFTMGVTPQDGVSHLGNSRKNMVRALEASLKRLKTERVDLYWVHMPDGATPTEEIVRGLDDLVRAGKIHYAGLSNFPAWRVARADLLAELRGWAPIAGIQIEYSLAERTPDRELLPMAEALGLGAALWSPLGGGFLTGKYRGGEEGRLKGLGMLVHTEKSARETAILDAVLAVAEETKAPATHVAIAWLREKAAHSTTALIPILGPRTRAQLDATLGALSLSLSPEQVTRLDTASEVSLGVPHASIKEFAPKLGGGKGDVIDAPVIPVS
ncbi:aldo/keto reductase [Chondromyces apiculatus]|uniref:Oxidoreductase, aldo/keto reductase family n=1 Tax=Chondromyces apiculatus DSM 436 TaxID=1192034 RepID=A0A017T5X3_9BACT|nr:aldo/keto reductase [Chondromyces apiculatus]EYF03986.1 Oxidoreductase, aldo/keto reductase family [Chondromyces apiculatus DSM 436]